MIKYFGTCHLGSRLLPLSESTRIKINQDIAWKSQASLHTPRGFTPKSNTFR
jgi:hypothetical protein